MNKTVGSLLLAAAFVLGGGTAQAENVSAANPASLVKVLQSKGYRAELTKDEGGDPMIKSASSGTDFVVLFYGCTANRDCSTVQFYAGFTDYPKTSLESLNAWNAKSRFGRGYISDKGVARIEMDLDLDDGGMSAALFEDNLEFWTTILANFEKHIDD